VAAAAQQGPTILACAMLALTAGVGSAADPTAEEIEAL
jgi:hypothetical protein